MKYFILSMLCMAMMACAGHKADNVVTNSEQTSNDESEDLIVGGQSITKKAEAALTTVSIINTRLGTLCTGSILSTEIVVTAAHCVEGDASDLQIHFGLKANTRVLRKAVDYQTSPAWKIHKEEKVNNGDIALIRFSGGLPKGYQAANVVKSSYQLKTGDTVMLAGFGITTGDSRDAGVLRAVEVKIADAKYSKTEVLLDQTQNKGACHGDSGGPAFVQNSNNELLLWGVTSRGVNDPTNECIGQSVYTKIVPYNKWINSVIKEWNKSKLDFEINTDEESSFEL